MKLFTTKIILMTAIAIVTSATFVAFAGFGVSPAHFITQNLSRGTHLEKSFVLSRSDPDYPYEVEVSYEGDNQDWISTNHGDTFVISKGVKRFPITINVDVPSETANGTYTGGVRLTSRAKTETVQEGASVSLALLITTEFSITGEQIFDYTITSMRLENTEVGGPLDMVLSIKNNGNVKANPSKITVEIEDKLEKKVLNTYEFTEIESVQPFSTGAVVINIPNEYNQGQYWAKIAAYTNEELIKEEKSTFEVLAPGRLEKKGELLEVYHEGSSTINNDITIIGTYKNTTTINHPAKLVVEVYSKDELLMTEESPSKIIKIDAIETLKAQYVPDKAGSYQIKAHVDYPGGNTDEKTLSFFIKKDNKSMPNAIYLSIIPFVLVMIISYRKFKRK